MVNILVTLIALHFVGLVISPRRAVSVSLINTLEEAEFIDMPDRYTADLSHLSNCAGKIGRLHAMACIPVVAGDSFDLDFTSVFRMSALRRSLTVDARVDVFGFYVPYRYIYGDDWTNFIKQGVDETVSLPVVSTAENLKFHACGNVITGSIPKWVIAGYNMIWNRYFRVPMITPTEIADDYVPTAEQDRFYGLHTAYLPSYLTPSGTPDITDDDHKLDVSGGTLDLIDLARIRARYKTEIQRSWFTQRYSELLEDVWTDRLIPVDAEDRPELLFRDVNWMSGHDVDGTGEGNLGQYAGKSQSVFQFRMPRKFFLEHGTVWIMCVVRYPTVVYQHSHFLVCNPDPSYKEIAGDPSVVATEPPSELLESDFVQSTPGASTSYGYFPFAQHYRFHPSYTHDKYQDQLGYPFLQNSDVKPGSLEDLTYVDSRAYDEVFQSDVLAHYQSITKFNIDAHRVVPPAISSIFAGT